MTFIWCTWSLQSYERLMYSFVPNCRGWSNCKFWEKNPQVHLIISNEWPTHALSPSNFNKPWLFPLRCILFDPTPNIRHKRVYSIFTHWIDQYLLLRPNKIKKYWSLPLTDSSILWHFCKWTINTGGIFHLSSCFLCFRNKSCSNSKLISFLRSPSCL